MDRDGIPSWPRWIDKECYCAPSSDLPGPQQPVTSSVSLLLLEHLPHHHPLPLVQNFLALPLPLLLSFLVASMKYLQASLLLAAWAARAALAELTYTVTGIQNGKPIKASDIVFQQVEPTLHRLNTTIQSQPKPKDRGGRVKRTNPVYYSSNWCGAVQHSVSTNKITSVHAYFQVPTLSQRTGVTTFPQYVATWVGIDGATWTSALLQSGVTSQVSTSLICLTLSVSSTSGY